MENFFSLTEELQVAFLVKVLQKQPELIKKAEEALRDQQIKDLRSKAKQLKHLYRISCSPSRSDHCAHSVGLFSSPDKTMSFIPVSESSYDSEDNCRWHYSVEVVNSSSVSDTMLLQLDKRPSNFPYYGL